MEGTLDYVSVGVNRVVNALAWGQHGGVAYAAHHMIALYDIPVMQLKTKGLSVLASVAGYLTASFPRIPTLHSLPRW